MDHQKVETEQQRSWKNIFLMGLGALGVVYGDIGTSPLYALKEIFLGKENAEINPTNVYGVLSTVFWVLTLVITFKYVVLVLKADHEDEGGVFALYARLKSIKLFNKKWLLLLLIFSAGLLLGDGLITPAISVISAVEGMAVAAPTLEEFVIPITILILSGLFFIQSSGTTTIGKFFGPIMLLWFASLALIGINNILIDPSIFRVISPIYALNFISNVPIHELLIVLGFVVLVVTGGEAMYADMGHFGRTPIRLSWLTIAYPALILNYFGQGAFLLSGKEIVGGSIFYSMVPQWQLYPLIVLATLATIIASQALITGSFSLVSQASALELLPPMKTRHTHKDHIGQIYISIINTSLYIGCVVLVLTFKSSSNLASAYGLAESGVMIVTTIIVSLIAIYEWKWKYWQAILVFIPLALIDTTFLIANSLKFFEGGFVPLTIGVGLMMVMVSWRWGMDRINAILKSKSHQTVGELFSMRKKNVIFADRSVFIVSDIPIKSLDDKSPPINGVYFSKYELLPEHLIYLTVVTHQEAEMKSRRIEVYELDTDPAHGTIISVVANFGFMEDVNLNKVFRQLKEKYPQMVHSDQKSWVFHIIHPKLFTKERFRTIKRKLEYSLFRIMWRNSMTTEDFIGVDHRMNVTAEVVPVKVN